MRGETWPFPRGGVRSLSLSRASKGIFSILSSSFVRQFYTWLIIVSANNANRYTYRVHGGIRAAANESSRAGIAYSHMQPHGKAKCMPRDLSDLGRDPRVIMLGPRRRITLAVTWVFKKEKQDDRGFAGCANSTGWDVFAASLNYITTRSGIFIHFNLSLFVEIAGVCCGGGAQPLCMRTVGSMFLLGNSLRDFFFSANSDNRLWLFVLGKNYKKNFQQFRSHLNILSFFNWAHRRDKRHACTHRPLAIE